MKIRCNRWSGLVLLMVALPLAGAANREAATSCPGADAWREAHRDQLPPALAQRDQARTFSDLPLRTELERRFGEDQRERRKLLANPTGREARNEVLRLDADNLAWLRNFVRTHGIPTAAQVGEMGVLWTWLLVQHADGDPQFQLDTQPVFVARHEAGELPADELAKLTDRVLLAAGRPQQYGTQFDWLSGHFNPKGGGSTADFEAHRKALGLMPLADYSCMMNRRLRQD